MQSWVRRASRAGSFAGGCILLFAVGASSSASAQSAYSGLFGGSFGRGNAGPAAEPLIDTRDFSLTPVVGLQETFTDNALLTATNKQFDFITRPMVGADIKLQNGPATGTLTLHGYYDAYAREGQLSGFSGDAQGSGSYSLIPSFLSIDGDVLLTNTGVSQFGSPAIDRAGTANRVMLATYDIGPRLTTTLDDFADVSVIGRFAQVYFGNPNNSTVGVPTDATILEGAASIDTAQRYVGYQLVTNAQVERDDQGFQAYNAQQSIFVRIFPQLRLIGRGGYDDVVQTGIVNISAPMWSGGVEFTINQQSKISVETGERYNHSAWAGDLRLQFSDQLYATGRYFEAIQPDQIQVNSSFVSFVTPNTQLPPQLLTNSFLINGNLDNQTSLNKEADLHLVYDWQGQSINLEATWNDRMLLALNAHDRSLVSGINYERNIAPDLDFAAGVTYYHTFSNPFYGASELYGGDVGLQYDINSTMQAVGGYAYRRQLQLFTNGQSITENVVFAAIAKKF